MSIGLIVSLIVLIAVVLTLAVDNDDRADRTAAPAAPLSYYVDGGGDGIVGGHDQAVVPALRSHTGDFQGEGRMNTAGDLSVMRPMAHYHPFAGEGLVGGDFYEGDVLSTEEQARLAHDEMLFNEWNDPLGWQAIPEPAAVMSYQDVLFLERNGIYGDVVIGVPPKLAEVDSYEWIRFVEINTQLPGWTEGATLATDRPGLTEF